MQVITYRISSLLYCIDVRNISIHSIHCITIHFIIIHSIISGRTQRHLDPAINEAVLANQLTADDSQQFGRSLSPDPRPHLDGSIEPPSSPASPKQQPAWTVEEANEEEKEEAEGAKEKDGAAEQNGVDEGTAEIEKEEVITEETVEENKDLLIPEPDQAKEETVSLVSSTTKSRRVHFADDLQAEEEEEKVEFFMTEKEELEEVKQETFDMGKEESVNVVEDLEINRDLEVNGDVVLEDEEEGTVEEENISYEPVTSVSIETKEK